MKVSQIATDLNEIYKEIIGTWQNDDGTPMLYQEDLSNFIDMSRRIINTEDYKNNYDHYVAQLIDRIGYTLIVDKELGDDGIKIESNRYEYGALLQKIRIKDVDFVDNEVWQLKANESYEYFDFKPVGMKANYFSDKTTFGVEWSWVAKVLKESMESVEKLTQLYAAIENRIMKKIKLTTREMKKRLVANLNGMNIAVGRAINLIQEYYDATGKLIYADKALTDVDFLKFTAMRLKMYKTFMADPTAILNPQGELNWTPKSNFRMVALTDLDAALTAYLYSSTYHEEFVKLDGYSTVANWQGTIPSFPFDVRSSINIVTTGMPDPEGELNPDGDNPYDKSAANAAVGKTDIAFTGIIATMFDSAGITIWNEEPEMNVAPFNPKGKFINYYYSYDCNYYYDSFENSMTFYISDYEPVVLSEQPDDWVTAAHKYFVLDGEGGYVTIGEAVEAGLHGLEPNEYAYLDIIKKTPVFADMHYDGEPTDPEE